MKHMHSQCKAHVNFFMSRCLKFHWRDALTIPHVLTVPAVGIHCVAGVL